MEIKMKNYLTSLLIALVGVVALCGCGPAVYVPSRPVTVIHTGGGYYRQPAVVVHTGGSYYRPPVVVHTYSRPVVRSYSTHVYSSGRSYSGGSSYRSSGSSRRH